MKLTIDLETRSTAELRGSSPWRYAEDPSTEVLCLAIKVDDQPTQLWVPDKFATGLVDRIDCCEAVNLVYGAEIIEAHNAEFETALWHHVLHKRYGWPDLPVENMRCSAARAAMCGLPRALGDACEALGLPIQKDAEGKKLMLRMCKPCARTKKNPTGWVEDPTSLAGLARYCMQDVDAEHALSAALPPLPPSELEIWQLDQKINRRGLFVDVPTCNAVISWTENHSSRMLGEFQSLTQGHVMAPTQVEQLLTFVNNRGLKLGDLTKSTVTAALAVPDLDPVVRRVLEIRQSAGKTSVAKYNALRKRVNADGRMRSNLLYHGAATGRWAGKGFQPQNLPREAIKDHDALFGALHIDEDWATALWGDPMLAASKLLRNVITAAPGHVLYCGDYASIESRVLNWIAGEQWALDAYRNGVDMYKLNASQIFGEPVDQIGKGDKRQVGKTAELALGYGGGIAAFATMARGYNIDLEQLPKLVLPSADERTRKKAEANAKLYAPTEMSLAAATACDVIKQRWRTAHPAVAQFWRQIQAAATAAVESPGTVVEYQRIRFVHSGSFLLLRLPVGRCLHYYQPRIKTDIVKGVNEDGTPYEFEAKRLTFMGVDGVTNQWLRMSTYGGKLTENIVQGISRDLCAHGMLEAERNGYPVVLSVHDEIVSETPADFGSVEEFEHLICRLPGWADQLPLSAEAWRGERYRK